VELTSAPKASSPLVSETDLAAKPGNLESLIATYINLWLHIVNHCCLDSFSASRGWEHGTC